MATLGFIRTTETSLDLRVILVTIGDAGVPADMTSASVANVSRTGEVKAELLCRL